MHRLWSFLLDAPRAAGLSTLTAVFLISACDDAPSAEKLIPPSELGAKQAAVVGGEPVTACQWPSTVMLDEQCTGTLIHARVVTTAAHCISSSGRSEIQFGVEAGGPVFTVEARCKTSGRGGLDWGYCILPEDERIAKLPITPPLVGCEAERFLKPGATGWIVGFGDTGPQGRGFGVKRHVEVVINDIRNGTINVGDREVGACHGDSGGPIYMELKENGVDYGVRVFGSTQGPGEPRCDCTCSSDYIDVRLHVAAIEEDEGIDVTPCTNTDGTWDPSPACTHLMTAASTATGTFPQCSVSRTQLPIASCGQPGLPTAGTGGMGPLAGAVAPVAGAGGMGPLAGAMAPVAGAGGAVAPAAGGGGAAAGAGAAGMAGVPASGAPAAGAGAAAAGAGAMRAPSDATSLPVAGAAPPVGAAGSLAGVAGSFAPTPALDDDGGCSVAGTGTRNANGGVWYLVVPLMLFVLRRRQGRHDGRAGMLKYSSITPAPRTEPRSVCAVSEDGREVAGPDCTAGVRTQADLHRHFINAVGKSWGPPRLVLPLFARRPRPCDGPCP